MNLNKAKVGDKIVIARPDMLHNEHMDKFIGKTYTIKAIAKERNDVSLLEEEVAGYRFTGEGFDLVVDMKEKAVKKEFKFDVGDRVRVFTNERFDGWAGGYIDVKEHGMIGKIYTISEVVPPVVDWKTGYRLKEDKGDWCIDERCLVRVRKAKIVPVILPAPLAEIAVPIPEIPRVPQVGDMVICINPSMDVELNKVYKIEHVEGEFYRLEGVFRLCYATRFKLATPDVPVIVPKKIEPAKKDTLSSLLRKKTGDTAGTCSYAIEYKDGHQVFHVRAPCHVDLPTWDRREISKVVLDIQGHVQQLLDRKYTLEHYRNYVNYILNVSPWAPIYHKLGIDHAFKHGVSLDVSKPLAQIQGAAVVLREGSEFPTQLALFNLLLEKGHSGNTAYLLSAAVSKVDGVYKYSGLRNGHKVLSSDQNKNKLIEFFREGYAIKNNDKPYSTEHYRTDGIAKHIAPIWEAVNSITPFLQSLLKVKGAGGWDFSPTIKTETLLEAADELDKLLNKEQF